MEKVADNYYRIDETMYPSSGVVMKMMIDRIDGEDLDTAVELSGRFAVAGFKRKEFCEKLGELINAYRI